MSKIIMWIVIVGVVAVGGYFAFNPKSPSEEIAVDETTPETDNQSVSEGKKMAFAEFIKGGGAYKCTVAQHVGEVTSSGTVYIDGSMVRGEFNSEINGLNVDSNMIVRDGFTYSWSSMTPNLGFKVKAVAPAEADTTAPTSASYSFNAEQIGDYDCAPWTADASLFTVPANINFQTIGE